MINWSSQVLYFFKVVYTVFDELQIEVLEVRVMSVLRESQCRLMQQKASTLKKTFLSQSNLKIEIYASKTLQELESRCDMWCKRADKLLNGVLGSLMDFWPF